jgi:hypothetical protein
MNWFSAKIRVACLIEGPGLVQYMDSIHVFRAENFDTAMKSAVNLGRRHEEEYINSKQERVRWRLKEIISLDILGEDLVDGAEVYSEPVEPKPMEHFDFGAEFDPGVSVPTQTL